MIFEHSIDYKAKLIEWKHFTFSTRASKIFDSTATYLIFITTKE